MKSQAHYIQPITQKRTALISFYLITSFIRFSISAYNLYNVHSLATRIFVSYEVEYQLGLILNTVWNRA